uniref:Serine/threonine-protein phosphatase 2A 55 kDa regulatory subunit B n=1 Tax=Fagus sylvatica TaxID=28930 RepID=A0A2N9IZ35_FAGSY
MTLTTDSHTPLEWKFSQVFGERAAGEDVLDVDIISSMGFEKSGNHLAVGDRGGRVVIFERKDGKDSLNGHLSRNELEQLDFSFTNHPEFRYKMEFQSHEPEFDYLKSLEIEEKINKLRWCETQYRSQFILSTNDKTIKLWKLGDLRISQLDIQKWKFPMVRSYYEMMRGTVEPDFPWKAIWKVNAPTKVKEHRVKKVKEMDPNPPVCTENALLAERSFISGQYNSSIDNGYHLEWTEKMATNTFPSQEVHSKIANIEDTARTRCRRMYSHAHDFNINSISTNSDGETFISADDLRINLWNLEISDQCFNIIDMKPSSMEDLTEVITSAEFHPFQCNLLAYSSSRGFIHLVDMRRSALCDHSARILQDGGSHGFKSFFTEIIASISDIKFSNDGRHILSRDYMNLKLWDIHMDSSPVATFKIHDHLHPKLCELYNNDSIFDKFDCCVSGDGNHFATGSYSNLLRIFSQGVGGAEGITIEASKNPNRNPVRDAAPRTRRSSLSNLTRGLYRLGWD